MSDESFETLIRKGQVAQPQQRDFSQEQWTSVFKSLKNPTGDDVALHATGLWFDQQLREIRNFLTKTRDEEVSPDIRIRGVISRMNREVIVLREKTKTTILRSAHEDKLLNVDKMMRGRVSSSRAPDTFLPDEVVTVATDLAPYVLDRAIYSKNKGRKLSDDEVFNRLDDACAAANVYHVISDLWLQCLWRGWRLLAKEKYDLLAPTQQPDARLQAVWDYRQEALKAVSFFTAARIWRTMIVQSEARQNFSYRSVLAIETFANKRRKFRLGKKMPKNDNLSAVTMVRLIKTGDYLENFLSENFPAFPSINANLLLDAWRVLADLCELLIGGIKGDTGVFDVGQLLRYSLLVRRDEINEILINCLRIEPGLSEKIIDFFSYKPRRLAGLWTHPLVPTRNELCLASAPLLYSNLTRSVEFWLREGKIDLKNRGTAFENQVRQQIFDALLHSKKLSNAKILMRSLDLGPEKEEIDLIFHIGETIIVGELKCNVVPSDPIEIHNHIAVDIDKEAIPQIIRKVTTVRREMATVCAALGLPFKIGISKNIVPIIVSNLAIGAGTPRQDIPIVDLAYLVQYLELGMVELDVTVTPEGKKEVSRTIHLYEDEKDAEANCRMHFCNQPIIETYIKAVTLRHRPLPVIQDKPAVYAYYEA